MTLRRQKDVKFDFGKFGSSRPGMIFTRSYDYGKVDFNRKTGMSNLFFPGQARSSQGYEVSRVLFYFSSP